MKRIFTLLCMVVLVASSFAQPPIKVLYLGGEVPPTAGDTLMPGFLEAMGFDVTVEALTPDSPTTDYDVVVISEVPGSGSAGWAHYGSAPLPLVHFKVHAMKTAALNWVATGDGVTGTDYDNSADTVVTFLAPLTHPVLYGFDGSEVQVVENTTEGANVGWVALGDAISGLTAVGQSGTEDATHQAVVALEAGTVMNGTNTLTSRAVIVGFHQVCWRFLNDAGKKMIKNSIYWAANRPQVNGIFDDFTVESTVYPNPSTGLVNLQFSEVISELTVNVLSIDGKTVFSTQLSNAQFDAIDLSELNAGMYFINFEGANISRTEKLILK